MQIATITHKKINSFPKAKFKLLVIPLDSMTLPKTSPPPKSIIVPQSMSFAVFQVKVLNRKRGTIDKIAAAPSWILYVENEGSSHKINAIAIHPSVTISCSDKRELLNSSDLFITREFLFRGKNQQRTE